MKFSFSLVLLLSIFSIQLQAQSLRGRVVDAGNQEGIPFVTVQLGENYGVISNAEGYFVLQLKTTNTDSPIIFSSMGFERLEIPLKDFEDEQVIRLKPATYALDEVLLFDKQLTAEDILEKFIAKAEENHQLSNARVQVFLRSNNDYKAETFAIDVEKASFLNRSERQKMNENIRNLGKKITQTSSTSYRERLTDIYAFEDTLINHYQKALNLINRKTTFDTEDIQNQVFLELLKSLESPNSFKVKSGIIPLDRDLSLNDMLEDLEEDQLKLPDTLRHKNAWRSESYKKHAIQFENDFFTSPKYYAYELVGVTKAYGQPCYHIRFTPDRRKGKYVGDLYINTRDFGMVSYTYDLEEGRKAMSVNLKFVLGIKANTFADSGFLIFSKNSDNTYYPKYIKQTNGDYAYINRSLSFKENHPNRSKRKKLTFEFEMEFNLIETIEYVGVEYQNIVPELKNDLSFEDYILIDEVEKYDTGYWKDYNIIEATEAIKDYK
ncbi:carboxypeptidase-like regulatory domain-containing protein [Psychroflexus sp. YR1-1]|uniref:Carboxypeptidase-like regulatory domain-containing protein n=1 Tax=Psychroflexus aurantiacus TaxID=2709310 RepID=A0A6B3R2N4_9FLAO|nr:carboxypeptidase-like regulatory domain-containing protein [Psychroflexus aurantiacus]NEV93317.1 carboxypeptidase-like regulatory domain-containing protein [Psychroflexus aurantiacus]